MSNKQDLFEDKVRDTTDERDFKNLTSKYRDLVYYESSVTKDIKLAMLVDKPAKPSYILVTTHGWHMTLPSFVENNDKPNDYLYIQVDMRGRKHSQGKQDCNGYELYDVIDAVETAKVLYKDLIIDDKIIFFEGGSGGGGNAYEIVAKFPDYFAAVTSMCGISDYLVWYKNDKVGEFRDELDVWIGNPENTESYDSRSGIKGLMNLYSPMCIFHGSDDIRVPCYHSRNYVEEAKRINKGDLVEFHELPGVGGADHFTNASQEYIDNLYKLSDEFRKRHMSTVEIPEKGRLMIQGYLVTKHFSVFLESIDKIGYIDYDLSNGKFDVQSACKFRFIKK